MRTDVGSRPGDVVPTLVDIALSHIRNAISTGIYPPGTRLKERDLSDELGISRIPIREALRTLATEGFVTFQPRRGVIVKTLVPEDLDDLFDVREALEVQATVMCACKASDEELLTLVETARSASKALKKKDVEELEAANNLFHDQIIEFAHSPLLGRMLNSVQSRLHWLFAQHTDATDICREHEAIAAAIFARDDQAARLLAQAHVETSRRLAHELLFARTGTE